MPLALPDIDDPLTLPDGTIFHTDGSVSRPARGARASVEIPTHHEARNIITNTRRALADLPLDPQSTNPVAVVLSYVLFGLSNTDIAIATGMTEDQVVNIKTTDAFTALYDSVKASIIEIEANNVRGFFNAASRGAAHKMLELMNSDDEKVSLGATKDVLDRAGHRPADVVNVNMLAQNVLRIEVVKKDETNKLSRPIIDLGAAQ